MRRKDFIRVVAGLGAAVFLPRRKQTELDRIRERHNILVEKTLRAYLDLKLKIAKLENEKLWK